jgi:FAD/FMN-containing dehydrogenase
MACDNLLSVDVVTAESKLVTASKIQNDDLFWALHGGGGNFGVVTSFEGVVQSMRRYAVTSVRCCFFERYWR